MIGFILLFMLLNVLMLISVIMFENCSKKIIFWALTISITSFLGYIVYLIFFSDKGFIKKTMLKKEKEDKIYLNLVNYEVKKENARCELMNFARKAYGVNFSKNSNMTIFDSNEAFLNELLEKIEKAEKSILIDTSMFLDNMSKDVITSLLCDKHKMGVLVKLCYSKIRVKDREYLRELKDNGVKVYKFNKHSSNNRYYTNNKNILIVDGEVAYISTKSKALPKKANVDLVDLYYKFTGEIVGEIDVQIHMDLTFASKKFLPLEKRDLGVQGKDNGEFMYIATNISNNPIDLILKAVISAKSSIVLHFDKFIPNESIIEAIKLAVKSNISVKLMISNVNHQLGYYTSRSYVKELASEGVCCYFYDGHINSNYIIIDDEIVMLGSLSMVNQSLSCDLQDIMIISSKGYAQTFLDKFSEAVKNSYKLNNPKRVLFREKFFRKFM